MAEKCGREVVNRKGTYLYIYIHVDIPTYLYKMVYNAARRHILHDKSEVPHMPVLGP